MGGQYFGLVEKLLGHLEKQMVEVVPEDEIAWVEEVLSSDREAVAAEVKKRVSVCKQHFEMKTPEEKGQAVSEAKQRASLVPGHEASCPSCSTPIRVIGSLKVRRSPRLKDDELSTESVYLPSKFECSACGLRLEGYSELDAAGLGGSFVGTEIVDAQEYYFEQFEDYMREPEYGND